MHGVTWDMPNLEFRTFSAPPQQRLLAKLCGVVLHTFLPWVASLLFYHACKQIYRLLMNTVLANWISLILLGLLSLLWKFGAVTQIVKVSTRYCVPVFACKSCHAIRACLKGMYNDKLEADEQPGILFVCAWFLCSIWFATYPKTKITDWTIYLLLRCFKYATY